MKDASDSYIRLDTLYRYLHFIRYRTYPHSDIKLLWKEAQQEVRQHYVVYCQLYKGTAQQGAAIFKIEEVSGVRSEKKLCTNFKKYL